jgi:uncharacterized protein involved in exopolysaccharide biosynthesis
LTQRDLLSAFVLTLFRRKVTLLVSFVVLLAGVGFYTYLEYPLYRSTDLILVRQNPRQQLTLFREISGPLFPNFQSKPANDVIEISRSTGVAREIVRRYGMKERIQQRAEDPQGFRENAWWWIGKILNSPIRFLEIVGIFEESIPTYEQDAIDQLVGDRLEVYRLHETELMKLSVWEEDPRVSTSMANDISALVIARTSELAQVQTSAAFQFIEEQVKVQGALLEGLESHVAQEKSSHNLIDLNQQQRMLLERIDTLNRELDKVLQAELGYEASITELERQLRTSGSKNLGMTIEGKIVQLRTENASWSAQKETLSRRIEEIQAQLLSLPEKQARLAQLERELKTQEQLYGNLNTKLEQIDIQQLYRLSEFDIQIVDAAYLPEHVGAAWPEWDFNLLIGLPAALALALLITLLAEYLNETYAREESLAEDLGVPVLGSVPRVTATHMNEWRQMTAMAG